MAQSNIVKQHFSTWGGLIDELNEFYYWRGYIFRGHAEYNWLLESTLTRALRPLKYPNKTELVNTHLKTFMAEIVGRRGDHPKDLTENELWALGQHFGLYTPLLDWSNSPYVALFFSLAPLECQSGKRCLWAFYTDDIERLNSKKKKSDSIEFVFPNVHENKRSVSQRGVFIKLGVNTELEQWVASGEEFEWGTLYQYTFPNSLREQGLAYLDLMNINFSSIYPDLIGSSLNSNIRLMQTDFIKNLQDDDWNRRNAGK